jgi:hypothetical protein
MATETKNKGNPKEAGGSTTKQKAFPMISSSLLSTITPQIAKGLKDMFPGKMERINDDDFERYLKEKRRGLFPQIGRQPKQNPELMPTQKLPERKVPRCEKPNMLDVVGGAKTIRVAKGGMVRKKSAKKSRKAGRAAKRGYGMAKRGK